MNKNDDSILIHCCFIGCGKAAEYEISTGNGPADYTHSCLEHIPNLMTNAEVHTILKIKGEK